MSLIRKHVAVLQAWACLALVFQNSVIEALESKSLSFQRNLSATLRHVQYEISKRHHD